MGDDEKDRSRTVICPRCHRIHLVEKVPVDQIIDCDCGFSFYAFVDHDLRIIMTPGEANYEPIARAMRRFVVATGRCTDIPYELICDTDEEKKYNMAVQEQSTDSELERVLEEYQMSAYGECFLTKEVIDSACELFRKGEDVVVKQKKDTVEVHEVKVRKYKKPAARQAARAGAYAKALEAKGHGGILMVTQCPETGPKKE